MRPINPPPRTHPFAAAGPHANHVHLKVQLITMVSAEYGGLGGCKPLQKTPQFKNKADPCTTFLTSLLRVTKFIEYSHAGAQ